ncbi:MAG: hypothetical protein LAO51_04505 [Acidobacteriia bacterium]|nr:hypothetical protein [Terriglobia bacterium]
MSVTYENVEATRDPAGTAEAKSRLEKPHAEGLAGAAPIPWPVAIQSLAGALRLHGVKASEVLAVGEWIAATEAALEEPVTPGDRGTLGSLARVKVLELRAARRLLERGMLTREGGVKPLSAEFRGYVRLGIDLQAQLHYRRGKPPGLDLAGYLAARRTEAASAALPVDVSSVQPPGPDAATAQPGSDAGNVAGQAAEVEADAPGSDPGEVGEEVRP